MDLRNDGTIGRWLMGSDFRANGGSWGWGRLGELIPEGGGGGEDPDEGDEEADAGSGDALGVSGTHVVAEEGAEGEDARFWPIDEAAGDEPGGGDEIEEGAEDIFEGVHLVDGAEAKEAKGREHEDADAGAEVTAVNGEGKLAGDGEGEWGSFVGLGWAGGRSFWRKPWMRKRVVAKRISQGTSWVKVAGSFWVRSALPRRPPARLTGMKRRR